MVLYNQGTIPAFAWWGWGKTQKTSMRITGVPAVSATGNLTISSLVIFTRDVLCRRSFKTNEYVSRPFKCNILMFKKFFYDATTIDHHQTSKPTPQRKHFICVLNTCHIPPTQFISQLIATQSADSHSSKENKNTSIALQTATTDFIHEE
jgi:hypothetical protein